MVGNVRSEFALITKHNLAASTSECTSAIVDELPRISPPCPPFSRTWMHRQSPEPLRLNVDANARGVASPQVYDPGTSALPGPDGLGNGPPCTMLVTGAMDVSKNTHPWRGPDEATNPEWRATTIGRRQGDRMRRLVALVSVVLAVGVTARWSAAQQVSRVPHVGVLHQGSPSHSPAGGEFREGIQSLGWIEGSTIAMIRRSCRQMPLCSLQKRST